MKASRMLSLLFVLQRGGSRTAASLAEELETSVRTLYRDVASLVAAGVPIVTSAGPGGGIALPPGWRTRLDGLTGDEASALLFAGMPHALADLGLFGAAVSAKAKLRATLPPDLHARIDRVAERFFLDAPGWFSKKEPTMHLAAIARAVWEGKKLDLRYGGALVRRVSPLGIVCKAGAWYLVAEVAEGRKKKLRVFRIGKVDRATVLRDPVVRPEGFRLGEHWTTSARTFEESLLVYRCELRLSRRARAILPRFVPQDSIRDDLACAGPDDPDGFADVVVRLESRDVAVSQLLPLGDGVEVLAPRELRAALVHAATRICEKNSLSDASAAPSRARRGGPP